MKKERINLKKGFVEKFEFDNMTLHAYQTNDLMNDECLILENNDNLLLLEMPPFHENFDEYSEYVNSLNKKVIGKIYSNHPNGGASLFKDVKSYASEGTIKSMKEGTIKYLNDNFKDSFGDLFDYELPTIDNILKDINVNIEGFNLNIKYNNENIEVEIPKINSIYTHMLGHDVHSIIGGVDHANMLIDELNDYVNKNYNLVLSSHYTPENIDNVKEKIEYIKNIINISNKCNTKEEFIEEVKKEYPNYNGLNYLDMTAANFYK